jgi:phosphoribosyl-AMP cyclohydrolase
MASAAADDIEEGSAFTPRFSADGLIACVAVDAESGEVLMLAYMNAEALDKTLATGVMHYWSRSRQKLWRKGDVSGQVQTVVELRVDCDQDAPAIPAAGLVSTGGSNPPPAARG